MPETGVCRASKLAFAVARTAEELVVMTYTGPFPFTNSGTIDGILVATSFTGNVLNNGTISTSGISVVGSSITGYVLTNGNISGGINVDRASTISTAANTFAIAIGSGSGANVAGGIHNGGIINGATEANNVEAIMAN